MRFERCKDTNIFETCKFFFEKFFIEHCKILKHNDKFV